ncbi:hypothetical protein [Lactobacillus brevis] [Lactiplantibacillus mudanjiangensis]|uniref:hypothetical protein n=1 Tax=Lactiplantibacillus mudanjiangensis TaxID=1296538 RepID=UPI001015C62F|nr:hypothetical protein [Lactobacillus brevis] [Lactiplantibacillus mudanjiangensis]
MAHTLYVTENFNVGGNKGTINGLEGRLSFIDQLSKYNNSLDDCKHDIWNLSAREKEYQKFLFYKYFFAAEKPVLVTEGKTDINYLKAALKSNYLRYPNLIILNSDGKFEFKVSFFKRTKRLKFFLGISKDGADSMKNIYSYFVSSQRGSERITNYLNYFLNLTKRKPKRPVIFVFDHELKSSHKKPLRVFVNALKNKKKNELEQKLNKENYVKIISNLYILTNPLVDNKDECEIEDLFDQQILETKINGKTFSREGEDETVYGKQVFSTHVLNNYSNINFDNFIPMLDALNKIIVSY